MIKTGKIKSLRENYGLTQEYMAEQLNISQPTYARLESGRQKITVEQLIRLSSLLQVSHVELLKIPGPQRNANNKADENSHPAHKSEQVVLPKKQYHQHMEYALEIISREHKERKALVRKIKKRHAARKL